jgi:hypothetical protein
MMGVRHETPDLGVPPGRCPYCGDRRATYDDLAIVCYGCGAYFEPSIGAAIIGRDPGDEHVERDDAHG